MPAVNRGLRFIPGCFQLFGVSKGLEDFNTFKSTVLYEPQMTGSLSLKSVRKRTSTTIAFSSESRRLRGGGLLYLKNGIANLDGAVYTRDKKMLVSRHEADEFLEKQLLKNCPTLLPRIEVVDEPLAALSAPGFNYFHWMYEVLPKIHLLDKAQCGGVKLYLHISNALQLEMLSALGIGADRIVNSVDHKFVKARELLVPYLVGPLGACKLLKRSYEGDEEKITLGNLDGCVGVAAWICSFLRGAFLNVETSAASKPSRVYISRNDAGKGRRIKEEARFIKQIQEHGFQTVSLTGMQFREQISIFKNAEVIIAPHGAGLTNLTFCKPGATCIELFGPSYVSDLYAVLSEVVGVRYLYLVGNGEHNWKSERSNQDIEFDHRELEDVLQLAEIQ